MEESNSWRTGPFNSQDLKGSTSRRHLRRKRRRRQRGHKKGRKMEGIRLRSDSDGSTKNAFYQGTIVSDSRHGNVIDNDYQFLNSISNPSEVLQDDYPRRKIKLKNEYNKGIPPPLPRRSMQNSPLGNTDEPFRLISPENSNSNTEDDDPIFTFSPERTDDSRQRDFVHRRDSLRYSILSFSSMASQQKQLLGTTFLNDDGSQDSDDEPFAELNFGSPLLGNFKYDDEDDLGGLSSGNKFGRRDSGVYFRQQNPSGPLPLTESRGITNSRYKSRNKSPDRISNNYPTQQASNIQYTENYGSINAMPSQKVHSNNPVTPTINEDYEGSEDSKDYNTFSNRIMVSVDISGWLSKDVAYDDEGVPYFESTTNCSIAGIIRWLFYNPFYPEFTSLQQFCWAVVLGVFMGIFTAGWKLLIDACLEFTWRTLPEKLLDLGLFSDLDGYFPLYHYMWITPGLISGILAYVVKSLPTPIPTQDDWIHSLHSNGIQDSDTFIPTFIISTIGMASGLSLGPELPLILTAGMIGSCLGRLCRQSLLQARVMNLTAASAAIGGMFGLPLAGGIFVMELPHRMGLQYFEALSPATIASIVAVLINRIVINNDVTGMFQYPFLSTSLPSYIFKDAIIFGLFGGALGMFYTFSVKKVKKYVHYLRDGCSISSTASSTNSTEHHDESTQTINSFSQKLAKMDRINPCPSFTMFISHAPTRAALTSTIAGIVVGTIGMFLPHVMFWGEAQLQTMIDKRTTPLPIFGQGDDPTSALVALGYCMVDGSESSGLSLGCSISIVFAKIFVTGLSLSTGIVGGHFWAPLFVGAAASQFFVEFVAISSDWLGTTTTLTEYPCVALLCIMGATHVVTFRAHMAIILILTLTIDAFVPEDSELRNLKVAGEYSAVFPLLTVAVFVALQISRQMVFYEKQRSRGDIQALPEALCEPGKEGKPLVMDYDGKLHALDESDYDYETDSDDDIDTLNTQEDIEANFQDNNNPQTPSLNLKAQQVFMKDDSKEESSVQLPVEPLVLNDPTLGSIQAAKSTTQTSALPRILNIEKRKDSKTKQKTLETLDRLFNGPIQRSTTKKKIPPSNSEKKKRTHRRTRSEPVVLEDVNHRMDSMCDSSSSSGWNSSPIWKKPILKRVDSYGEIDQGQPSLMDQARRRAASVAKADGRKKKT
mmetsp:Transcript_3413/g.4044  ORF Transcript_3413/g.4044 Transcript_3413/m.4044 type:complete len:1163 (-) Transcript_3413:71-3559(-)